MRRRTRGPGQWTRRTLHALAARGVFGLVPLDLHVVICGHPRSGTTLLKTMLETAYPEAHSLSKEKYALGALRAFWPGRHRILITKRPNDVMVIDRIRAYYRGRSTRVCFLVTTRDPRDQLTSRHRARPGEYYVTPERWRTLHSAIARHRGDADVLTIDYGELVTDPDAIQARVEAFLERPASREFHAFHRHVRPGVRLTALNGLRPVGSEKIGRWRDTEHAGRLLEVLELLPELETIVIEEGYESDRDWIRQLSHRRGRTRQAI